MSGATDFAAAQRANRRNTFVLLLGLTLIAAFMGYLVGWALEGTATDSVPLWSRTGLVAAAVMAAASLCWSGVALAFGDRMVLAMSDARAIEKSDAPVLYDVVDEMSVAAGLPMPRVMVLDTDALNAFATGTTARTATIVVTRGLIDKLSRDELQGVVAHETSHLANLDTRYMTVVGVTVGLIALVADMILRTLNWGGSVNARSSSGKKDSSGGAAILLIVVLVVVAIFAPLAAKAVQMAVSRQREYLADATSVQFTRNPNGLISALRKLGQSAAPFPGVSHATQHLFIVNPVQQFTADTPALLATHPDIEDRIARLRNLGG